MQYSDSILNTPSSFIRNILKVTDSADVISFAGGLPNPISFPIGQLKESVNHAIDESGAKVFQYSTTQGYLPLRQYIAEKHNKKQPGLDYTADDVLITTGSQQALELISKVLLNKGDGVIIEEPGYLGAIQAFTLREPTFHGVTLETEGINIAELKEALEKPNVKMVYTVPNFQNPTGLTYTQKRREEVYEAVKNEDIIFIEDDPYGELRFTGEHLPYIAAGKMENSVLIGSFSKTVAPGMRLGYMLTKNHEFLSHVETAKQASDLHTNIFAQYTLHHYLTNNAYEKHVEKIIALYKEQSDAMLTAIEKYFPPYVSYTKPEGGMFIWVTLPEGVNALEKFHEAMDQKVAFVPGNPFYTSKKEVNTMRLNYTNATPEIIEEGIKRLGEIL